MPPQVDPRFETVLGWCDELRTLGVRANADTPEDARRARAFGAEGVGLCRTEHMFMAADRQPKMQAMIMADDEAGRRAALDELLPLQQADFEGLFEAMDGLPVTIRLLDPPLHEFLPDREAVVEHLTEARVRGNGEVTELEHVLERMRALEEGNPMLGTRGVRLGLLHPEIYEMQARAIFRAARAVRERTGHAPSVEVMIPLVAYTRELELARALVERVAAEEGAERRQDRDDDRAAAGVPAAGAIAAHADFFSFGTNDLTQTAPRLLARRHRGADHAALRQPAGSSSARRSGRSTPRASASSSRSRWSVGGRASPSSRPASAASTAETRARSASSTLPGSTTSAARRSACRSRGWRRRRRRTRSSRPWSADAARMRRGTCSGTWGWKGGVPWPPFLPSIRRALGEPPRRRFDVPEMWAALAIGVIWLAVLVDALFGPDIVSSTAKWLRPDPVGHRPRVLRLARDLGDREVRVVMLGYDRSAAQSVAAARRWRHVTALDALLELASPVRSRAARAARRPAAPG